MVLPGLFGSLEQFRARFALPIERDRDEAARAALAAVVRPFLLRRNKGDVAKELPARTELTLQVELTDAERRLYDDARLAALAELEGGAAADEKKRFAVLAALTRLRQIACHPRLLELLTDLKAGGVGLNLTAADYVVHLDPWWNPAVEDQATDRAHRIGQTRPVTVYRLIAQGTVEEGIVALHHDKRNLVAGVLDGSAAAGSLSTAELVALIGATPTP